MSWGLVAGAVGAVAGAAISSDAAGDASDTQAAASAAGIGEQRRQYDITRADFAPYRDVGRYALEQLTGRRSTVGQTVNNFDPVAYLRANPDVGAAGMDAWSHYQRYGAAEGRPFTWTQEAQEQLARPQGSGVGELDRPVTAEEVMQDPGYQFGQQQGQQALDRKIASMGGRVSGAAIKAATRFGTDYATSGYNAAYQRRQDRLNRLAALAGIGQTATGSSAAAGANATNAITGLIERQGDASAAAGMARGNIWADAGNQIAALYGRNRQSSAWADPSMFSNRGGSFGTSGLDSFYYGNGTGGD